MLKKISKNIFIFSLLISSTACGNIVQSIPAQQQDDLVNQESFFRKISDYPKVQPKFFNKKYPVNVIAHRGYSDAAPENTLSAARKAVQIGANMVEMDVGLTSDGEIVLMHDDDVKRTTNGEGLVENMSLAELKKLDAGSWFNPAFRGEQVPTLDEILEYAKGKISLNIEIKSYSVEKRSQFGIEKKIVDALEKYGMTEYVIISSFNEKALLRIKQINPRIPTALLIVSDGLFSSQVKKAAKVKADAINEYSKFLRNGEIKRSQSYGLQVNTYTVDEPAKIASLIEHGINGIITNRPDLVLRILQEKFPKADLSNKN